MATKKNNSDFLNQFIDDRTSNLNQNVGEIKDMMVNQTNAQSSQSTLGFLSVDLKILPSGIFYKPGTQIKIKAATVSEVQAYSVVDDANMIDVTEKMNQMLSSCVKIIHPNASIGSYKDLKDADRIFLIFMIRELTFQQGCNLAKDVTCNSCGTDFKINFRSTGNASQPKSFICYEMDEKLLKYAPHLAINSEGSSVICRPSASFICVENITTAIPLVNPTTKGCGKYFSKVPNRSSPNIINRNPANTVEIISPSIPYFSIIPYTITMNAPVGPAI